MLTTMQSKLHCVIVKTVELVDLVEMRKTDSFGQTRLVLHVSSSSRAEKRNYCCTYSSKRQSCILHLFYNVLFVIVAQEQIDSELSESYSLLASQEQIDSEWSRSNSLLPSQEQN